MDYDLHIQENTTTLYCLDLRPRVLYTHSLSSNTTSATKAKKKIPESEFLLHVEKLFQAWKLEWTEHHVGVNMEIKHTGSEDSGELITD